MFHSFTSKIIFKLKKNILFREVKKISGSTLPIPAILHDVMGECRSGTADDWARLRFKSYLVCLIFAPQICHSHNSLYS